MIRKIALLALWLLCLPVYAQNDPEKVIEDGYAQEIEKIFGQLELNRVPHGLLYNAAFPYADLEAYNGTITDSTQMSVDVLSSIYKTLQSSRVAANTSLDFISLENYAGKWAQYRQTNNQDEQDVTLVLSGAYYKYSVIPDQSFHEGKINVERNALKDVYKNGKWQNPYEVKEVLALAPPTQVMNVLNFSVVLPQELFLSNDKRGINNIKIDFDNGQGLQTVNFDQKIALSYPAAGRYNWTVEFEKIGGGKLKVGIPILIHDPIDFYPINPGPYLNNVSVTNGNSKAILRIDYAPGSNGKIKKPLIVAEGFDPESLLKPEKVGGSTTLNNFTNSLNTDSELWNLLQTNTQQYDIVYVDWKNGVDDIKINADLLIKVIEWVNTKKQAAGSTEPNVVLGQSMGGLVATYALSKMEKTPGKNHDTSLLIAHDSPFQGANTPISTQFMFRHMYSVYQSNAFVSTIGEVVIPFVQSLSDLMGLNILSNYVSPGTALGIQDTPAALQMTKYHVTPNGSVTSDFHDTWKNEFDTMGYPQQTRNVAISNGNMCAVPQDIAGSEQLFYLNGDSSTSNVLKEVLTHLGVATWGFTSGDWVLGIVASLPGKSKVKPTIELRAIPEPGSNFIRVYKGHVRYTVILWDIMGWRPSISKDIVRERTNNSPSGLLPLETFSGGYNNIKAAANSINFVSIPEEAFVKPVHGFIPVASALDIRRNNTNNLSLLDFRTAYSSENLGDVNLSTPFENFVTERTVVNTDNFRHISFSPRNGNWLAQELMANSNPNNDYPEADCSAFCSAEELFGPDYMCGGNNNEYTYSIPQITNATISWSAPGLTILSGQGTSSVTVKSNGTAGTKTIKVTINSTECGYKIIEKQVHVGVPTMSGEIEGVSSIFVHHSDWQASGFSMNYTAPEAIGATYYEWELPGNYQEVSQLSHHSEYIFNWELLASTANSRQIKAKSDWHTDGQIKVRACNDCGCSDYITLDVEHIVQNYNGGIGLSPNPVGIDGSIQVYFTDATPPVFRNDITDGYIYDMQTVMRKSFQISSKGTTIDISGLQSGVYIVVIDMQDGTTRSANLQVNR